MTGPISNERNEFLTTAYLGAGSKFIEKGTNRLNNIDIRSFALPAHAIGLTHPASHRDRHKRSGMVLDIEPVADIVAGSIDW